MYIGRRMCICICICMYVYIYIYVCVCLCMHMCTCRFVSICRCMCACMGIWWVSAYTSMCVRIRVCICTCAYACTCTCTRAIYTHLAFMLRSPCVGNASSFTKRLKSRFRTAAMRLAQQWDGSKLIDHGSWNHPLDSGQLRMRLRCPIQ